MNKQEKNTEAIQGIAEVTKETKRKVGKASTLKSFGVLIKNMKEAEILNKEEIKKLEELQEIAVKKYLGYSLEI